MMTKIFYIDRQLKVTIFTFFRGKRDRI